MAIPGNDVVPAGLYKTTCKRSRGIANQDLVVHSSKGKRETHHRSRKLRRLLPSQAEITSLDDTKCDASAGSELPGFDDVYRRWRYVMRRHDMSDAAIFRHQGAAPMEYF